MDTDIKTVVPLKRNEKIRLYEWCLTILKEEFDYQEYLKKYGYVIIRYLKRLLHLIHQHKKMITLKIILIIHLVIHIEPNKK